ncbi:hypothetical protein L602_000400001300 [Cupriavidus gilardii J11]|uniref:Uncharacterized protein n=1 Tax=Cupriavidus gilardii J11 TaxID=936133 RepID=A0A562B9E6_9BURK|nr:hypothetical protein [Cupriavidus gilardii]TWG81811.1 hypothetical protein L602_000400001300 [Cupriavidus gilardii J11]
MKTNPPNRSRDEPVPTPIDSRSGSLHGTPPDTSGDAEREREREIRDEAGAIPSSLDPEADIEPIDSDMNLEGMPEAEQDYPNDNRTEAILPEEQIGERIADAAEGIAPDMPSDRADRTDEREERPPRHEPEP